MEFVDLSTQQKRIREKIVQNIDNVFEHGKYIMGPEIKVLEDRLAKYVGVKHAIGCSSGTDALLLSLMANRVGPGDLIFTTPFTFIATAEVISLLGAIPVFVDIDKDTFNIDPVQLEKAIMAVHSNDNAKYPLPGFSSKPSHMTPKGVIAVDLFGLPAAYSEINKIAKDHNLFVIEDAAQSFGAEYNGQKACSLAEIGCTSFFPAKPLGCYGDGGMCFTDDDEKANIIRSILVHGQGSHKYDNTRIGINGRLDTLQAAILLAKFDIFPEEVLLRQKVAQIYTDTLNKRSNNISPPNIYPSSPSVWAQYSILANDTLHRTSIQTKLNENGIPTAIYYPMPLHLQGAFSYLGYKKGDFKISEDCSERIFSIPMHPYLTESERIRILDILVSA